MVWLNWCAEPSLSLLSHSLEQEIVFRIIRILWREYQRELMQRQQAQGQTQVQAVPRAPLA